MIFKIYEQGSKTPVASYLSGKLKFLSAMKYKYILTFILIYTAFPVKTNSQTGEWLNNRYLYTNGCRQNGMAGVGFSLLDDENLIFMNPAGLGLVNERLKKIAFSYGNSFEPHRDWSYLVHDHYVSSCLQPFKRYVGGLSFLADFYILSQKDDLAQTQYDPVTQQIIAGDTYSGNDINIMSIIGYGRDLSFINWINHAVGISAVFNSRYQGNFGDPVSVNSLHLNAGYAGSFSDLFHLGFVFINIPVVKSFNSDATIVTPFCISPSFGFSPVFVKRGDVDAFKMFTEFNYKFAIEKHENFGGGVVDSMGNVISSYSDEKKFIKTHFYTHGYEFGIKEIVFLRNGYRLIFDNEFDLKKILIAGGVGISNRKHFEINLFFNLHIFRSDYLRIDPAKRFGISVNFFNIGKG